MLFTTKNSRKKQIGANKKNIPEKSQRQSRLAPVPTMVDTTICLSNNSRPMVPVEMVPVGVFFSAGRKLATWNFVKKFP